MGNLAGNLKIMQAEPELDSQTKPRVLVVDDVADNREILRRRLVRRDFDVEEANGGVEALKAIEANSYDIILLDIMMPDLNGREVLDEIRKSYSSSALPVIMVTAKSQSEDVVECLEAGANDYVTKPVDFAIALARINAQLEVKQKHDAQLVDREKLVSETEELSQVAAQERKLREEREQALKIETKRRERSEEEMHFLAFHDSLTGLLNRVAFDDAVEQTFSQSKENTDISPALLFVDLDAFKSINDLHGHKIGDMLLKQVADRIVEIVGPNGSVARLGGDEFAIAYLARKQPAETIELAERIVAGLSQPFEVDGLVCEIGASCGVAEAIRGDEDTTELMRAADLAMYRGKAAGRGKVVLFEPSMMEHERQRRALEIDLKIAAQKGEFELFFQPLMSTKTKEIVCFEALLRWEHPTRGMISPEVFVPMAEELGLISNIGNWVLRRACEEAATWDENVSVAVNVSALQFKGNDLVSSIVNALATSQLDPSRLELEITETVLMSDSDYTVQNLKAIRELGVRLSLDDFGTGYSSLAYLKEYSFDSIKIDKSFIQSLGLAGADESIIKAIKNISDGLGIGTTAEGVETSEQLARVTEIGCSQAQGYLLSRPITSDDARELLGTWSDKKKVVGLE